jgi:hypothetical protein
MATANPAKPVKKSRRWRDLFFFRRRPHFRGISLEWEHPGNDEDYQKLINDEGFVSANYWTQGDISQHPIIMRDLKDLEEYLLPTFFQFSQKSKYFQNQFYLYQWVFVWGAFLTTVFGSVAALYAQPPGGSVAAEAQSIQHFFNILTAIVGASTAFFTALSNRGDPQKRWGKNRRLAEELRMHYFTYLSHIEPYDRPDRVQKLRENVINIRVKEQENV